MGFIDLLGRTNLKKQNSKTYEKHVKNHEHKTNIGYKKQKGARWWDVEGRPAGSPGTVVAAHHLSRMVAS